MQSYVSEARDNISCDLLLLEEVVPTYQERLGSYVKKSLQRIRNVWHVTWRRCCNLAGTSCKLHNKHVATLTWWRCLNVLRTSGTSCKSRTEDVTTYQEHLASYLKKMLQRIRNVLQLTYRRCYNVGAGVARFVPIPVPFQIRTAQI